MKTTQCRWCGGEMECVDMTTDTIASLEGFHVWVCGNCQLQSQVFSNKAEALEWASQLIPFLPEIDITEGVSTQDYLDGAFDVHNHVTSTLAVKTTEE